MHQATPPGISCLARLTINRSSSPLYFTPYNSGLSNFEWFLPFAEFINWSVAGNSTSQGLNAMTLFRPFVVVVDHYELECHMRGNCGETSGKPKREKVRNSWNCMECCQY